MFGRSIRLFDLFGISVKIDASWLLLAALISWSLAEGFPATEGGLTVTTYWLMGVAGAAGLFLSEESTVGPDDDAMEALSKMVRANRSRLPVVGSGRLLGILAPRTWSSSSRCGWSSSTTEASPLGADRRR